MSLNGLYKIAAHTTEVKISQFKATYLRPKFLRSGDTKLKSKNRLKLIKIITLKIDSWVFLELRTRIWAFLHCGCERMLYTNVLK